MIIHYNFFYKICQKLQLVIAPKLKYSQTIYEDVLSKECVKGNVWLDLGCGHHLLPPWRFRQEVKLIKKSRIMVGIDYDFYSLIQHRTIRDKIRGDISKLPFSDESFDLITSNMVFEHLDNPENQLKEIARVLKTGGKLVFHTPNIFSYPTIMARMIPEIIKDKLVYILEGRKEEDVFPAYYRINSFSRIAKIANISGLKIVKIKMLCSLPKFVIIPPIVIFELFWIKLLMTKMMKPFRTNIIAIIEKA